MNDADTLRAAADLLDQTGVQLWLTQDAGESASGRNVKAEVAELLREECRWLYWPESAAVVLARRILGEVP